MKTYLIRYLSYSFVLSFSLAQIEFQVNWTPYVTYYLSMVNINTGESNMPIFSAELSRDEDAPENVDVDIIFEIIIDSDVLGVNNETLLKVETTSPLTISAPIYLSNMDLNLSTGSIFDIEGNTIDLNLDITEQMDLSNAQDMMNSIIQSGQLPNGIYTFKVTASCVNGEIITKEDVLNISNPSFLQLVSPGGILPDTTINEVFSSYPVFQWESDPCNYVDPFNGEQGCIYFIRVAEFKSSEHSSVDQAIESVTRLPLDQSLGFQEVGFGITTFQYPSSNVGDLEQGKVYVWQVRKDLITTSGIEQIFSDIMSFKIKDFTSSAVISNTLEDASPEGILLKSILGDNITNNIFGPGGDAQGMVTNGNISLNGEGIDLSTAQNIISRGISDLDENGNEIFRPIEILSIEVID